MAKKSKKNTSKKKKPAKKAVKKAKAKKPAKKLLPKKKPTAKKAKKKVIKTAKKKIAAKKLKPVKVKPLAKKVTLKEKIITKPVIIQKEEIKPIVEKQVPVLKKEPKPIVVTEEKPPPIPKKVIRTTFSSVALKEDKKKAPHPNQYSFEYVMHASPGLLFEMISTPSGLSEWFSSDVNIRDGNFTFIWDGSQQVAKLVAYKENKFVRFQWLDKPDYSFFEFKIEVDELTNEASVIITDFDEDDDKESARMMWDNEIAKLKKAIGS